MNLAFVLEKYLPMEQLTPSFWQGQKDQGEKNKSMEEKKKEAERTQRTAKLGGREEKKGIDRKEERTASRTDSALICPDSFPSSP